MLERMSVLLRIAALMAVILPSPAIAEWRVLELDPQHTRVSMTVHATMHEVEGALGPGSGRIEFDLTTRRARGDVVVDLAGATTDIKRRDRKMHDKVLETDRFPRAVFHVERIGGVAALREGTNEIELAGDLELHGESHPVTVQALVELRGDRVHATGSARIPYLDWGLRDPSFFVVRVAKEVVLAIEAGGRLEPSAAAAMPGSTIVVTAGP